MAKENHQRQKVEDVSLVRILGKDIPGNKSTLAGIIRIKGVSWPFANAACKILSLDRKKVIQDLDAKEIERIESFIKNPSIPSFMKNRQKDPETGEDKHIQGEDVKLQKEFDVKRLRKIKSYRGIRHAANLPVRGQRTKANFRRNRRKNSASGIKKKDKK
jgi:small subunit ribosomal protein S13